MSAVAERESTELVTLPAQETVLQVYSTAGGLDPLIEQIRAKVSGVVYDMSTKKGRDECASDAFKVAKSKAAIERLGKALSAEYKEIPKKIDAERRRAFDELEALQKQVRQPLTEWEEAEEARLDAHKARLSEMESCAVSLDGRTTDELASAISLIEEYPINNTWEEFEAEAARTKDAALSKLRATFAARQKYEAEQTELARLRAESEARRIQDEQDRIALEAAEAATKAAEAKAQAERDAAAKREADAKAAQAKAEQDAKDAAERQRRAEEQAETERLASAERVKQATENARLAEVKRQADEAARIEAEAKAREANQQHRLNLMGEAKQALMGMNITEELARAIVLKIARGEVPNVRIHF